MVTVLIDMNQDNGPMHTCTVTSLQKPMLMGLECALKKMVQKKIPWGLQLKLAIFHGPLETSKAIQDFRIANCCSQPACPCQETYHAPGGQGGGGGRGTMEKKAPIEEISFAVCSLHLLVVL